ncbi:hypothetical protein GmHk_07G018998 [Glycine max]|nr:hypothetical protein GmHk_07G018998 [Glycine max]
MLLAQAIQKQNTAPHVLSRRGYDYLEQKLLAEKTKKKLEEAAQSGSVDGVIYPPSPVRRHVKWKMARTKKTGEMTTEVAKEITEKIGLAPPPEPLVGPSVPRVSTKGSCVDPSGNDPETGDSDRCGLYIEADLARLVAMGRVHEGFTVVHNISLLPGQVKVSLEEVTDADAPVPVPTDEVSLVGQTLHTFLAWPTHLVKSLSQQVVVSPAKPPPKPDPEVDDPLYLMTLTIPELFLRPYQVTWDATVFGVFNLDFSLYIKHEDLSEIAHDGQCLSISVLQLWILHFTDTSMRAGNSDIYGFLEPQSIQRSGQSQFKSESYIKSWMQSSKRDVYLGAYLNGPDNYLKGIINRPLEPERLKALQIQWAQYYLRVRDQT